MRKIIISTIAIASVLTAISSATTTRVKAEIVQKAAIIQPTALLQPRTVDERIGRVIAEGYRQGYSQVLADQRGHMIANGVFGSFGVRLQAGVTYRFAGRCDEDCNDLDLILEDSDHHELTADRDPDNTPAFIYTPSWTGDYVVHLELANCIARQCQVGAVVLAHR